MRKLMFLALAAAAFTAGCDDEFGPGDWSTVPDTVTLFSLNRPEYQRMPSAFDAASEPVLPVVVESPGATGAWDIALTEAAGALRFSPAGVLGVSSTAAIAVDSTRGFDAVREAPRDTAAYRRTESVPVSSDRVYVVQSRRVSTVVGSCVRFAKFRTVAIDPAEGTASIEVVNNINCNDRSLVPPGGD